MKILIICMKFSILKIFEVTISKPAFPALPPAYPTVDCVIKE